VSFTRGIKSTLGPRGRGASTARAVQGYVQDDHSFTRGPGAIAALDAASPRRRIARAKAMGAALVLDAARARAAMGPALRAASSANGQARAVARRTVLPGVKIASAVRPGSVQVAKYPGIPGYQPYGGKVKATKPGSIVGGRAGGAYGFSRGTDVVAMPGYGTGTGYGAPQTGVTVGTPQAGGVTQQPGQIDPGSSGGGGGGGDYGTPGDPGSSSGGGGSDPGYDPGSDPGTDPTDASSSAATDAGAQADLTALTTTTSAPAISSRTRNWLIAGAALFGAYLIYKD
jgi:hypothetical protein